tara:strand:+ start:7498 stop:8232 length:735 start_codon:yes stop_codon:yes gene_type:complete
MDIKAVQPRSYKKILLITSVVLVVASIFIHLLGNYPVYRLFRGLISLIFLGIVLAFSTKKVNQILVAFMFFYSVSSICTVWYENTAIAATSLFLNVFAYLFLIRAVWPKASFKNLGVVLSTVFAGLIIINGYLLYEFISKLKDLANGDATFSAMLLVSMSLVVLGFLSLLYNHSVNTKASLVFLIVAFLFVFAEIFRAIGYYDFGYGNTSVYIARVVLIIAIAMLSHFMLMPKNKEEKLASKLL